MYMYTEYAYVYMQICTSYMQICTSTHSYECITRGELHSAKGKKYICTFIYIYIYICT